MIFNMQGENFFNNQLSNQSYYNSVRRINNIGNDLITPTENQSYYIQHQNIFNIHNLMFSHFSQENKKETENAIESRNEQNQNKAIIKKNKTASKVSLSKKIGKRDIKSSGTTSRLKNIIKNYGQKCANFAIGEHGYPIIKQKLDQEEISRFRHFIRSKVKGITSIHNFREMLLAADDDTAEIEKFKEVFQFVSVIFIENYSMNWIMNSERLKDVKGHIFARFKILRRVKDPKNFTYIH